MRKEIRAYRHSIDRLIADNPPETDWRGVMDEHLIKIRFFAHERLVHLIVTALFAVIEMMELGIMLTCEPQAAILAMTFFTTILLIAYIYHYYVLENEVQKMYAQYDKMLEYLKRGHF